MKPESKPAIGGWLWLPLVWLMLTLLIYTLVLLNYLGQLFDQDIRENLSAQPYGVLIQVGASLLTALAVWVYTGWIARLFYQRSSRLPRHYIIWLLLTVVLAVKSWAFSPVSEIIATRNLLISLLAAAIFAIYLRRSERVKATFILP